MELMTLLQAYEILKQISRSAPVNGDVGDKRDEALAVFKNRVDAEALKAQTPKEN